MTRSRSLRDWRRLWPLALGPLVWAAFAAAGAWQERTDRPDDPAEVAARVRSAFHGWLAEASALTRHALDVSPWSAAAAGSGPLAERLEGVGQVDGRTYLDWQGRPIAPDAEWTRPGAPVWSVRHDGLRTRLIVRAGPNGLGIGALATFVLDAPFAGQTFDELLDSRLRERNRIEVAFGATADEGGFASAYPLDSPEGDLLGRLRVTAEPVGAAADRTRRLGRAAALVWTLLVLLAIFDWRSLCRHSAGLLAAWSTIAVARGLLLWDDTPLRLLPREAASATLFGSPAGWGLIGSPADLALSALAVFLAAAALRVRLTGGSGRRPRLARALVATAGALATVLLLGRMSQALALHSRIKVLALDNLLAPEGPLWALLGWLGLLLAAAELAATAWCLWRRSRLTRMAVTAALLPLAAWSSGLFLTHDDAMRLDRLDGEYRAAVLEQSAHRRVALDAALAHCAESLARHGSAPQGAASAFRLWLESELYYGGYQSSIELWSSFGQPVGRFGFGIPSLHAEIDLEGTLDAGEPWIVAETVTIGALPQRVLHGEVPVLRDGETVGFVVGHVIDEPSNLPFLPGVAPYLAAFAPAAEEEAAAVPQYVLYDRRGTVRLSTLAEPPPLTREMEIAATREGRVRLTVGNDRFTGLPLLDGNDVHLLLMRSRSWLDRAAGFVRLSLPALGLVFGLFVGLTLLRGAGPLRWWRALRASFHRRLLATMMLASIVPLVGLSLFVREYVERRGERSRLTEAVQSVRVAQRVVEDYLLSRPEEERAAMIESDDILHWLGRLVEREIHVYRDGLLEASSRRELFDSGLLPPTLPGAVAEQLGKRGLPYQVLDTAFGAGEISVAYAPLRASGIPAGLVVAVPLVDGGEDIERSVERLSEMLLLATAVLIAVLAVAAAALARSVARPVRALVSATARIADGDYSARLVPQTQDEIAELVAGFNGMADALATQRADLERRRDYVETLLRNATTGVASTDPSGRLVTRNPALTRVLGLPADALTPGDPLHVTLGAFEELRPLAERVAPTQPRSSEPREIDLESGEGLRRLRVVCVDLPDPAGGTSGSLVLVDDVTDIMRSNQLAAWAEMARAIAHEIKNPLTPIQLSIQHLERLLADRGVPPSDDERSCIDTVKKQVTALREIAGEFSTYAKLPVLAPERCTPAELLREVAEPYRTVEQRGIVLDERYGQTSEIDVDRKVLGRALVNLIENALQAMPDGGRLTLAVRQAGPSTVRLEVGDTGSGLDPEVRARLFEPYFSTKSSGTGLGLAIVRQAVEAHGGTIGFDSERGRGTTFRIDLPAAQPASAASAT